MKISEKLAPALIEIDLESDNKNDLFHEMVRLLVEAGELSDHDAAVHALLEREEQMSTGLGSGLGLPHGKMEHVHELLMALGISKKGIDYDALDGENVYVVLMVIADRNNPGPHIEALAEISRVFAVPGFTAKLRGASTAEQVLDMIREEE